MNEQADRHMYMEIDLIWQKGGGTEGGCVSVGSYRSTRHELMLEMAAHVVVVVHRVHDYSMHSANCSNGVLL